MTTLDQQTFRDAMACVGAAVNIITTDGPREWRALPQARYAA